MKKMRTGTVHSLVPADPAVHRLAVSEAAVPRQPAAYSQAAC